MSVEIEEIALFGLFTRGGWTVQIREDQFKEIMMLSQELLPIALDFQKLYRLGFIRQEDGTLFRQHGEIKFFLRSLKDGRWEFYLNGGDRIRIVHYIHQVQRIWFDLFDDHLHIPRDRKPKADPTLKSRTFQRRH